MPCAISSYEGAEVNISTYFEHSDDNRPFYPFVIYSRTTQRALSRLKVCTHWATNRLPATLLVGRCVSRSGSGTCHQRSDGCCVILRPRDLQVCLGSLSQPDNKLCLLRLNLSFQDKNTRMTCLLRPSDVSQSEAAAKVGMEVEARCEISPEGSDYSSLFNAGLLTFSVLSSCCIRG